MTATAVALGRCHGVGVVGGGGIGRTAAAAAGGRGGRGGVGAGEGGTDPRVKCLAVLLIDLCADLTVDQACDTSWCDAGLQRSIMQVEILLYQCTVFVKANVPLFTSAVRQSSPGRHFQS